MLKYIPLLALLFFSFPAYSVNCDPEEEDCPPTAEELAAEAEAKKPFKFVEVRKVKGMKKEEIIKHIASYIAENFGSAKKVIEFNDPKLGKLIGNVILMKKEIGFFTICAGIEVTIIIDAKDGRFRLSPKNIVGLMKDHKPMGWSGSAKDIEGHNAYRIKPVAYEVLNDFITEMTNYLKSANKNSDW